MKVPCKNIPTYNFRSKKWTTTNFKDQIEFGTFLMENCYKEPGEYKFNKKCKEWRKSGDSFTKKNRYTDYAEGTPEYYDFWDSEELKCRLGVLWKDGKNWFYTTRDYYFLLNYCPIINKEKAYTETFMDIRDVQYHMSLYEKIAECFHLHSCILKRRQMAYSLCHVAKSVNILWFENKKRIKWFASNDDFLTGLDGSWHMLVLMRSHLNENTDWNRQFEPDKLGELKQAYKYKNKYGEWDLEGNFSTVKATSLGKDPKKGVGGACYWAWYEEGGIAPTADITLQYMDQALLSGNMRVGSFCIGGSVGDLKECKPLEKFMKAPDTYGFFGVPTKWFDNTKIEKTCGLFIPAQYGMPGAIDEFGNSMPDLALDLIYKAEHEGFKKGENGRIQDEKPWKELPHEEYVLKKSQQPTTIKEAFAWRKESKFNVQKIERRQEQIKIQEERNDITTKKGLLYETPDGKIKLKPLSSYETHLKPLELGYPIDPKTPDKRGVVTIWEEPLDGENVYFAGVDTIDGDDNSNTDSVMSIHIYKRSVKEIGLDDNNKSNISYKGSKLVASWRGRFKLEEDTNHHGWLLIRYYKAFAAIERNKRGFINYGRRKNFNRYIARESDLPFDKDLKFTTANTSYGVWMDNQGKKRKIIEDTLKEYMNREVSTIHKKEKDGTIGEVVKTIRGIDFIDDYWLLEELKLYNDDRNADSVVSAGLALCLGFSREVEYEKEVYNIQEDIKPAKNTNNPVTFFGGSRKRTRNLL